MINAEACIAGHINGLFIFKYKYRNYQVNVNSISFYVSEMQFEKFFTLKRDVLRSHVAKSMIEENKQILTFFFPKSA